MSVVAVVGLGYVGLPLAVEFGKKQRTIGYDLSADKIDNYRRGVDPAGEISSARAEAIIAAVSHRELLARPLSDFQSKLADQGCFIDVKSQFDQTALRDAGHCVWRL